MDIDMKLTGAHARAFDKSDNFSTSTIHLNDAAESN